MEEIKYYTLFGIKLTTDENMTPLFTRDFVLRWSSIEREGAKSALALSKDEVFKVSQEEAVDIYKINNEINSITGIKLRLTFCPEISAHLFETDFVLTDEWLQILIDSANSSDYGKKLLVNSKIKI